MFLEFGKWWVEFCKSRLLTTRKHNNMSIYSLYWANEIALWGIFSSFIGFSLKWPENAKGAEEGIAPETTRWRFRPHSFQLFNSTVYCLSCHIFASDNHSALGKSTQTTFQVREYFFTGQSKENISIMREQLI